MVSKRLLIGQRIALGFLVPLIALILIGSFSLRNLEQLQSDTQWVTHTVEVISELRVFTGAFSRVESAGRGYLISADEGLRADVDDGYKVAFSALERLRNLTIDNSIQTVRIDRLTVLLTRRAELSRSMIGFQANHGTSDQSTDLLRQGLATAKEVTSIADAMNGEEARLLVLRREASAHALQITRGTVVYGSLVALLFVTIGGLMLARSITQPLSALQTSATRIGNGEYSHRVRITREDEIGHLGDVFNTMATQVERRQQVLADQDWVKSALAKFNAVFQQQRDPATVCAAVLNELSSLLHVQASAIYLASFDDANAPLRLGAAFAAENLPAEIKSGEGLVGESFAENRRFSIEQTPTDYFRIGSALGNAKPACLLVEPVAFEGRAVAVMELASFKAFTPLELQLVSQLTPALGIVLQTIAAIRVTERLLQESQELGSALAAQRQSLADKNDELEVQAERLRKSEGQLQEQQVELQQSNEELEQSNEELQQSNEEMEEKSNMLAEQKRELEDKNKAIEQARREVQEQARQLAVTSKYKSDFLATMSHELRTPLNSLLILARLLGENRDANLTAKQVQFAQTIASSGTDLLEMINQILDLAKIESGTVELEIEDVPAADVERSLEHQFRQLAVEKKLNFGITLAPGLPEWVRTDPRRLNQVLKNLLSNAFKFTEKGGVTVVIKPATDGWPRSNFALERAKGVIAIAVTDTGIGIPVDKQRLVFESFQQADAGTSRRFGGTGLGLSISRELASLLGGALTLESELGKGSTFTLFVPTVLEGKSNAGAKPAPDVQPAPAPKIETPIVLEEMDESGVEDDRKGLVPGQRAILIIEDDNRFARILVDFAREKGFKALVASSAHAGMALAQRYLPVAITLDLRLSDEGGWVVLDRLKHDERTRHIPVHLISVEPARERGLKLGAVSYLQKPVTREAIDAILQQTVEFIDRPMKNLLVVEDNAVQRQTICELIGNGDVHTTAVATAAEALAELAKGHYDCIVLDLMLPDKPGVELIREINKRMGLHTPPVIIYTGKELSQKDETELRSLSDSIIVKDARSPERLLDETALFLHRVQSRLPEAKRRMLEQVRKQDAILTGRRVLVVDDDVRNIFALTAALEAYGMLVRFAESGQTALTMLQDDANCDVVLMDVMMPGMDGYETIRRIREVPKFGTLPVIAVTAKAMKGDRERCIEAGASDYITKPVITEKLLSLLRVWLYR